MSNMYGRQVVLPLTNKSGGGVIAGDVVIIDTGNDSAFTTTTTGAYQGSVGVAQETIANNAVGRVLVSGYAALVNVNASVTRGNYVKTHTVVKQATGSGTRVAGVFGQFLTGGTTPAAWLWGFPDNAGATGSTVATDPIWDAAGDLVQGTGADTAAKLTAGSTSQVLTSAGAAAANSWKYPPGYEFDYVGKSTTTAISATTEGTANTHITGTAVTYNGTDIVLIEVFMPRIDMPLAGGPGRAFLVLLYEDSTLLGRLAVLSNPTTSAMIQAGTWSLRRTPSNASHQYIVKAYVSGDSATISAGAGGTGDQVASYLRVTKV